MSKTILYIQTALAARPWIDPSDMIYELSASSGIAIVQICNALHEMGYFSPKIQVAKESAIEIYGDIFGVDNNLGVLHASKTND